MAVTDYSYLYEKYSEYISAEQLYQICHIAKRKAKWLLDNGVIPCHNSGKKTRCYRVRLEDVINYLQVCEHDSEAVIAPVGTFCSYQSVSPIAQIDRTEYERYLGVEWAEAPDMLTATDIQNLLGYSITATRRWMSDGWLRSILLQGNKRVTAKHWLIEFTTEYTVKHPRRLSPLHRKIAERFIKSNVEDSNKRL